MLRVDTTEASQGRLPIEQPPLPSEMYVQMAFPGILTRLDLIALYVVIIFFITNVSSAVAGGPAGLTLWVLGGLAFFIPCAIATAQLAVISPHEGSLYSWTHKLFGGYMSFFVGFCAWFPGPLLILATADLFVTYLQGLNAAWLVAPWQQGVVILAVVALSYFVSIQRHRLVQNLINYAFFLCLLIVALVVVATLVWVLGGHASATDFTHISDWNPFTGTNIPLYGVITLGYLGVNLPLNLGDELASSNAPGKRRAISSHLLWGTIIVLVAYLLATLGVLIIEGGPKAEFNFFSVASSVGVVLGPIAQDVAAICVMAILFIATVAYSSVYARFLLVGGIDQRLPVRLGKLNRYRIPANSLLIQGAITVILVVLFFIIAPYTGLLGIGPTSLAQDVYWVGVGTATLMWAFGTAFLFVNVFWLVLKRSDLLQTHRLFPSWVLILASTVGLIDGLLAIVGTALNSYYPAIPNNIWTILVVFLTAIFLAIGVLASIFAHSEASWETMRATLNAVPRQEQK
jgi:glutamate:GABA antiporter